MDYVLTFIPAPNKRGKLQSNESDREPPIGEERPVKFTVCTLISLWSLIGGGQQIPSASFMVQSCIWCYLPTVLIPAGNGGPGSPGTRTSKAAKFALEKCHETLVKHIHPQIAAVADALHEKNVIDKDELKQAKNDQSPDASRTKELLEGLVKKMEIIPDMFFTMCDVFEKMSLTCVQDLRGNACSTFTTCVSVIIYMCMHFFDRRASETVQGIKITYLLMTRL